MTATKQQRRQETMQRFEEQVEAERRKLDDLSLATNELMEMFHCGDFHTELAAARLIEQRGKAAVMDDVLAGLNHRKWKVRRTCADLLDHSGDSRCVEPLLDALSDDNENVRRLALHSLTCQTCKEQPLEGDFVKPLAERALADRSLRVRRIATNALANFIRDERAVAALRQIVAQAQDPVLLSRAQSALARPNCGDGADS